MISISKELQQKNDQLIKLLKNYQKLIIAFSGGLDSTFLLKKALEALGKEKILAVTAFSDSLATEELKAALQIAHSLKAVHRIILTEEFQNEEYLKNSPKRCYFCKDELFKKLKEVALEEGFSDIAYGAIVDDEGDFRPGMTAAREHGILSPLQSVRLSKAEIRILAQDLPVWKKPAMPCLSSRVPYHEVITAEKLQQIQEGEKFLRALGLLIVRVRHHGKIARIEAGSGEVALLMESENRKAIIKKFKTLGFDFMTIDLEGYRQGSFITTSQDLSTSAVGPAPNDRLLKSQ